MHLRTTNPIESIFAGVRLRTNVSKHLPNVNNALCLVFKIVQRLAQHRRKVTGSTVAPVRSHDHWPLEVIMLIMRKVT